jgi:hypothetical protein
MCQARPGKAARESKIRLKSLVIDSSANLIACRACPRKPLVRYITESRRAMARWLDEPIDVRLTKLQNASKRPSGGDIRLAVTILISRTWS